LLTFIEFHLFLPKRIIDHIRIPDHRALII